MTGTHPGRASLAVFILTAVLLLAACTSSSTGVSEVRLEAARTACQHVLPTSPSLTPAALRQCVLAGVCPHALVAMALTEMRNFARCMRGHGVSHWPDPSLGPNSVPSFDLSGAGYSRAQANSALIRQMQATCSHEMPDVGGAPVR